MTEKIDYNGMVSLFATPVFLSHITDEKIIDDATDNILKLKEKTPGVQRYGGWVTDDNLQKLPEFSSLSNVLLDAGKVALDEMTIKRDSHYISCMWANTAPIGTAHGEHVHSNSIYSGVLYLRTPEGAGPTLFSDPRPVVNMLRPDYEKPSPMYLGARWGQLPKKGDLIIFPSWLPHSVETVPKNETLGDDARISLSFNIMIRSNVEFDTAKIEFK